MHAESRAAKARVSTRQPPSTRDTLPLTLREGAIRRLLLLCISGGRCALAAATLLADLAMPAAALDIVPDGPPPEQPEATAKRN
jgi:hypothetical protein